MKIAIIGRTGMLLSTAKKMFEAGYEIVMIITAKASPEYSAKEDAFKEFAEKSNIPFFFGNKINDFAEEISLIKPELGISMNWPGIIGGNIISLFEYGILNSHPGDLPRYRGNACPNWAMINNEKRVALTIHYMEPGSLDSGDILEKEYYSINEQTSITDIYRWLDEIVPYAYIKAVKGIEEKTIVATKQVDTGLVPLRAYPRILLDSFIDWNLDVKEIELLIRASTSPFLGAYTYYNGRKMHILEASYQYADEEMCASNGQVLWRDTNSGYIGVKATNGILIIKKIGIENTESLPAEVIKSLRTRLGMDICAEIENLKEEVNRLKELIGV